MNGKRTRGRSGRNKPSNPRNQTFDSNGPEGKVRGSANQVFEKYLALARDAQSSGDRIGAENFFQHAEHYYRILNVNAQGDRNRQQGNGMGQSGKVNGRGAPQPGSAAPQGGSEKPAGAAQENGAEVRNGEPASRGKRASKSTTAADDASAEAAES